MKKHSTLFQQAVITIVMLALIVSSGTVGVFADGTADTTIRIVHTNDIHGYYTTNKSGSIGFAYLKTLIDSQNADLVLDAGDTYHGQAFATVEQGASIASLMKAAGYDAMTVGNHDWSYGADRLKELEALQGFPILAANVMKNQTDGYFDTPYLVKEVTADDGTKLRVGVFGVIDDEFYSSTPSENVAGLSFSEEATVAASVAETLRSTEHCDIVIALTHQSDCEQFVSHIRGVDAVIAGHEHILIDKSYHDADGKAVAVVEAGYYFYDIGVLSLTYDTETKTIAQASEVVYTAEQTTALEPDSTVSTLIAGIEASQQELLSETVGTSKETYEYSWEDIRAGQLPIGRIVTAAYLDRTGADVAFENAGGIRAGIPAGSVSYKDLISISPYGNTLVTKQLTGKQILDIVEYSLELSQSCDAVYTLQKQAVAEGKDPMEYSWPKNSGSVLQISGINVHYDMSRPAGHRIVTAEINGKTVESERLYTVATNNYVAGNQEYGAISEAALVKEYGSCEQALRAYVAKGNFEETAKTENLTVYTEPQKPVDEEKPVDEQEPVAPERKPEADPVKQDDGVKQAPQTGDNGITVWLFLSVSSLSALFLLNRKKRRA